MHMPLVSAHRQHVPLVSTLRRYRSALRESVHEDFVARSWAGVMGMHAATWKHRQIMIVFRDHQFESHAYMERTGEKPLTDYPVPMQMHACSNMRITHSHAQQPVMHRRMQRHACVADTPNASVLSHNMYHLGNCVTQPSVKFVVHLQFLVKLAMPR